MRTYQKHARLSMMSFLFCISLLIPCQPLGREKKFPATLPRFTAKPLILLSIAAELRESSRSFPGGRENCDARTARSGSGGGARDRRPGDDRDRYRARHRCRGERRAGTSRGTEGARRPTALPLRSATRHHRRGSNAGLLSLQGESWLQDKLPTILDKARTPWREHNGGTAAQTFRLGS